MAFYILFNFGRIPLYIYKSVGRFASHLSFPAQLSPGDVHLQVGSLILISSYVPRKPMQRAVSFVFGCALMLILVELAEHTLSTFENNLVVLLPPPQISLDFPEKRKEQLKSPVPSGHIQIQLSVSRYVKSWAEKHVG